jgi:hypothetical protein
MKKDSWHKKFFLLSWRKAWIIVVGWFFVVMMHNLISSLFEFEDALFFIIAIIVMPLYVMVAFVYSLIYLLLKGGKNEIKKKS